MNKEKENKKILFANNLKRLLSERKKTQKDLAVFFGIGKPAISLWVKGETMPKAQKLNAIASFLGVTTDELLSNPEHQPKKDNFKIHFFEDYDYDQLPEEKKEKIRQFIKLLLEDESNIPT